VMPFQPSSKMPRIALDWEVGYSKSIDQIPEEWIPASVPGAVQLDYARAHEWPDYWNSDEFIFPCTARFEGETSG